MLRLSKHFEPFFRNLLLGEFDALPGGFNRLIEIASAQSFRAIKICVREIGFAIIAV
jgi:hypothetical protein